MTIEERPLSPSAVNTYLSCSAKWFYRYKLRLPDPPSGSLVRGRAVHKLVNHWFEHKIEGYTPAVEELGDAYDEIWEREAEGAAFGSGEDIDELKRSGAELAAKYLTEAAPEIEPAYLDMPVEGEIGGVPVRGFVDLIDISGRVVDLKTSSRKPSGVSPDYALQLATYAQITPGVTGEVRIDTVVATRQPQLVSIGYTVSAEDRRMTERLYPHVKRGMDSGYYCPNRNAMTCSQRHCPYWSECVSEFGGHVS